MSRINDMNVFTDSENSDEENKTIRINESISSSSVVTISYCTEPDIVLHTVPQELANSTASSSIATFSYSTEPDIVVHKMRQEHVGLANSMSFSSDSDSDFVDPSELSTVKVQVSTPRKSPKKKLKKKAVNINRSDSEQSTAENSETEIRLSQSQSSQENQSQSISTTQKTIEVKIIEPQKTRKKRLKRGPASYKRDVSKQSTAENSETDSRSQSSQESQSGNLSTTQKIVEAKNREAQKTLKKKSKRRAENDKSSVTEQSIAENSETEICSSRSQSSHESQSKSLSTIQKTVGTKILKPQKTRKKKLNGGTEKDRSSTSENSEIEICTSQSQSSQTNSAISTDDLSVSKYRNKFKNNNSNLSKSKSSKINIISDELMKTPSNTNSKEKPHVVRNIFKTQINERNDIGTQVDTESKGLGCQNERNLQKFSLKRSLNVSTQTNIEVILSDEEENTQRVARKNIVPMQVSPPKRQRTIHDDCPIMRLFDEHRCQLEEARINLSELYHEVVPSTSKLPNIYKNESEKKSNTTLRKNYGQTPMKQLTIAQLNFCKSTPRVEITPRTTPNSTPVKSSPKSSQKSPKQSPVKSPKKSQKTPEKKETRYTQESHNRLYENVVKILEWVFENEYFRILFTKSEIELLRKLFESDRRLIVFCLRLNTRQHRWFNLLNLCEELNLTSDGFNLKEFHKALTANFVTGDYSKERTELLLNYLNLDDIKEICKSLKIRLRSGKQNMINKLLEYSTTQCTLTSVRADQVLRRTVEQKLGICVKLDTKLKDFLFRVHLLYSFTNTDLQTTNDIYNLMYKIRSKEIQIPEVEVDSPQLFCERQDFLKFAEACVLKIEFYEQLEKKVIATQYSLCEKAFERLKKLLADDTQISNDKKKPLMLRRYTAAWVYCRVLESGSQHLGNKYPNDVCEWLKEMLKQKVYCVHNRGRWYLHLALVTGAHRKDKTGEIQILIDGLSDKFVDEVQQHEMSIRGSKIKKGKLPTLLYDRLHCLLLPEVEIPVSRTIQANAVHNNEPGRKLLFVKSTDEGKEYSSVEETAINYYTTQDIYEHGIHCEGQLPNALFFIMFWDIIYETHVQNTFLTEIQDKPLDLFTREFYSNRSGKINTRLANIRDKWTLDELCNKALQSYCEHNAEFKSVTNFDLIQEDTLPIIIKCIGQKVLAAILERFAKDYKQFHSGLPDLFLWNSNQLKCCFVEVKSENDKLSTKQILWINYLHQFGAKVEVCHVEHIGSRSTKKIKKLKENK